MASLDRGRDDGGTLVKHRPNDTTDPPDHPAARSGEQRNGSPVRRVRDASPADNALKERIGKLEARLSGARSTDTYISALYDGMRSLVGELIRRRRQAEETCELLTRVLEATSDGFIALDADWRYTYVNEHAGRMFGRDPASLVGKHIWTEFPEGVGQEFHLAYERAVREGQPIQIEAYYPPYDRWFENRIYPHEGGVAVFFQDVTDRRLADDRLRESEQRYRSLFDHHPDAIYSFDAEGRFVSANAACEALTGYRIDELRGKPIGSLAVPEDRERALEHFRAALAGSARSYEESIVHKSGRRIDIAITKLPIVVDNETVGIYGIAHDLTAQRELESRLQQAEKMQAIGRLASGIAHDFNNLLTIIQSCATMLATDLPENESAQADIGQIQTATRRAAELTQQLLAFSRKQVLNPRRLDVNDRITTFVGMLSRIIGSTITVKTDLAEDVWPVFADAGQLERVLMNLGLNARDAMPNGGALLVRTANVTLDASAADHAGLVAGPYVSLEVEDTGTGIDPAVRPHIFEPFVTTKAHGLGTGLGLATVYGIVEQTGGAIQVSSAPGRGSRFTIYLPRAGENTDADA
jgi:PAS domain S-box-containing protein